MLPAATVVQTVTQVSEAKPVTIPANANADIATVEKEKIEKEEKDEEELEEKVICPLESNP